MTDVCNFSLFLQELSDLKKTLNVEVDQLRSVRSLALHSTLVLILTTLYSNLLAYNRMAADWASQVMGQAGWG